MALKIGLAAVLAVLAALALRTPSHRNDVALASTTQAGRTTQDESARLATTPGNGASAEPVLAAASATDTCAGGDVVAYEPNGQSPSDRQFNAHDLAPYSDGSGGYLWALTTDAVPGGCRIEVFYGFSSATIPGGAIDLSTDSTSIPNAGVWAVQSASYGSGIFHLADVRYPQTPAWSQIAGQALEIANGDGQTWVIGTNLVGPGGHGIYHYVGGAAVWQAINGSADHIAVASDGSVWVIQTNGDIYRYDPMGNWSNIPGKALQISTGGGPNVYVIGTNPTTGGFGVYRYVGAPLWWTALGENNSVADGGTAVFVGGPGYFLLRNLSGTSSRSAPAQRPIR